MAFEIAMRQLKNTLQGLNGPPLCEYENSQLNLTTAPLSRLKYGAFLHGRRREPRVE
jgi:hypothetical protein